MGTPKAVLNCENNTASLATRKAPAAIPKATWSLDNDKTIPIILTSPFSRGPIGYATAPLYVISAVGNSAVPNFCLSLSIVKEFLISFSLLPGSQEGTINAATLVDDCTPIGFAVTIP